MEQEPSYRPSSETLAAYFAGEVSSEEKRAVERWKAVSEANREELDQLHLVWQDLGVLRSKEMSVDIDTAFQQVKQKKEALAQPKARSPIWRIAATVLLLVTVSWWFWKPNAKPLVFASKGVQEINLSDGSLVTLNDQAVLTYPVTFGGNERSLQLEGEAFFSVEKDQSRPFRIQAGPVTITVLGTEFNVNATEKFVEVSVASGRVEVLSDFVTEAVDGGQSILVNLENESFTNGSNSFSGTEFYWIDEKLAFDGVELSVVLAELKTIFDVTTSVSNEAILKCRLQAAFEGESLEEIIEIIALSQNLEVSFVGGDYLLTGEGCDF